MSLSDARRRLIGRLRRRKSRIKEGLVLVEGVRSAGEVLKSGARVRSAVCSPRLRTTELGSRLAVALDHSNIETHWITDDDLAAVSDTEASQGVLLIATEPHPDPADLISSAGRILIVDGVQDPGNMGTLVRAAAAFEADGVIALDGTVDPWSAKAVRASAGTVFRLPVTQADWDLVRSRVEEVSLSLVVAESGGVDVDLADPGPGWALAVGSEAHGVRAQIRAAAELSVAVPMPGGTESLNVGVAGAILLYALWRNTPNA